MAKKVLVAKNMPSDKADALIEVIKAPPSTAKDVKKIANSDGTFNVEASFDSA
jgi:hypothetical protein